MGSRICQLFCLFVIAYTAMFLYRDGASRAFAAPATQPSSLAFAPVPEAIGKLLHNAHFVTAEIISGAQPDDDAAFAALEKLGIKTIISVDGATPNVELAHKHHMRYVHLPIGYDGVTDDQGRAIAKALDEMPGPIYIHCHHGKHRSAAAVAVACVMNGKLKPEQAESVLKTFGTGVNYTGLWKAAREARPVDPTILKAMDVQFAETRKIDELAEQMVAVDQRCDLMKLAQKAGWQVPKDHPDIDPPHEALQLQEQLHEIGRMESLKSRPDDFHKLLLRSEQESVALESALRESPIDAGKVNAAFDRVNTSCTACHKVYRD